MRSRSPQSRAQVDNPLDCIALVCLQPPFVAFDRNAGSATKHPSAPPAACGKSRTHSGRPRSSRRSARLSQRPLRAVRLNKVQHGIFATNITLLINGSDASWPTLQIRFAHNEAVRHILARTCVFIDRDEIYSLRHRVLRLHPSERSPRSPTVRRALHCAALRHPSERRLC